MAILLRVDYIPQPFPRRFPPSSDHVLRDTQFGGTCVSPSYLSVKITVFYSRMEWNVSVLFSNEIGKFTIVLGMWSLLKA